MLRCGRGSFLMKNVSSWKQREEKWACRRQCAEESLWHDNICFRRKICDMITFVWGEDCSAVRVCKQWKMEWVWRCWWCLKCGVIVLWTIKIILLLFCCFYCCWSAFLCATDHLSLFCLMTLAHIVGAADVTQTYKWHCLEIILFLMRDLGTQKKNKHHPES